MEVKLYDYQQKLIDNSKEKYMYITDTGTGKTLIALFHFKKYKKMGQRLLIIAPATKVKEKGWEREIKKVFGENLDFEFEIKSYDKFSNELAKLPSKKGLEYSPYFNTFVIFDEGHYIKNRTSNRTKNIKKYLKKTNNPFIILTATPTPNGYKDYGSYLEIFGKVKSAYDYETTYGVYDMRLLQQSIPVIVKWNNTSRIDAMYNDITSKPLKKEDCLDLPELTIIDLYFEKSKEYKSICKTFEKIPNLKIRKNDVLDGKVIDKLKEKSEKNIIKIKKELDEKLLKTKDVYMSDFYTKLEDCLTSRQKLVAMLREYGNPIEKIAYIKEFLENTNNNIIIFYNFKSEYNLLLEMCESLDNKKIIYTINGSKFTKPNNSKIPSENTVTLVQLQAGSSAIELQYANVVFYFTPTWTYQDYKQSIGRVYRNGQKNKVSVYRMIVEKSFESKIAKLLDNTEEFNYIKIIERDLYEKES